MTVVVSGLLLTSCDSDSSAGVSKVTNYAVFEDHGESTVFVPLGGTYDDPGVTATENGAVIPTEITFSGNYRGSKTLDVNKADEYIQSYTATNQDGFKATFARKVIVYKTGDLVNSIEGVYTCTIARNGTTPSDAYKNIKYIYIWKNTDGSYEVSDSFGGWYAYGRALGITYITPGAKIIANNIATNDFTFPGTQANSGFGGSSKITGLTVNAATKTIVLTDLWAADPSTNYTFTATLTQVQL